MELEEKLIIGTQVKIGKQFADYIRIDELTEGKIITLVEGHFEYDNGLYIQDQTAPSWWNKDADDFESIYHLWGNKLTDFMDCEIVIVGG